jgi:DNA invertase Pin-like site-specific DNA recombinase
MKRVVWHLDELLRKGVPLLLVLYMRVSTLEQRKRRNLKNRRRWLRRKMRKQGLTWQRPVYSEPKSGKTLGRTERPELFNAIAAAKQLEAGNPGKVVVLVTDTLDRFVRNPQYNGQPSTAFPTDAQLAELQRVADHTLLATVLRPDATLDEVKRHEQEVAKAGGKPVGRPRKRPKLSRRRYSDEEKSILVARAHQGLRRGRSQRSIGKRLEVPVSTLRKFLRASNGVRTNGFL